jgi:hypothetical protein
LRQKEKPLVERSLLSNSAFQSLTAHNTRVRGMSSAAALRSMAASRVATRRAGYAPGSNGFKKGIQN